jgi:hypothetical protein
MEDEDTWGSAKLEKGCVHIYNFDTILVYNEG